MKSKTAAAAVILAGLVGVASVFLLRQRPPSESAPVLPPRVDVVPQAATVAVPEPLPEPRSASPPQAAIPAELKSSAPPTSPKVAPRPAPAPGKAKAPPVDPLARIALSYVGADPSAEGYWEDAINDPTLPAEERKDLIEDLNEDGLSDPKHPGPQDLPLIINRLEIIEAIGGSAMDQVNLDAFGEAYKDLTTMYQRLTGMAWPPGPG